MSVSVLEARHAFPSKSRDEEESSHPGMEASLGETVEKVAT